MVNVPERKEVPKKTIQTHSIMKRGRATITKKDDASGKRPRKEKMRPLQKTVMWVNLWLLDTLWTLICHNLALKCAI
jgi:hypothetical protein